MNQTTLGEVAPILQQYASAAKHHIASAQIVVSGNPVPKYGLLAQHAKAVEVWVYALPEMQATYPHSFVDGSSRIYVSSDLVGQVISEEPEVGDGMVSLIMLHQMRLLMNHSMRITHLSDGRSIPEDVAQIAGETSAYCKLRMGFPELKWARCVCDEIAARSLPESMVDCFGRIAEEAIAWHIMETCSDVRTHMGMATGDAVVLLCALSFLDMEPAHCVHSACRDADFVAKAVGVSERSELLAATCDGHDHADRWCGARALDIQRRL